MVCSGCGKKLAEGSRFCSGCGLEVASVTAAPKGDSIPGDRPEKKGTDKKVLLIAATVVLLVGVGVFIAVGGLKSITGEENQPVEMAADGPAPATETAPSGQPQETVAQPATDMVQPADTTAVAPKRPAQNPFQMLEGKWEGTWNAGHASSGFCTATIKQARFNALCYDSRFSGRLITGRRGEILLEGGNSSWACRTSRDRGKPVLRCSFSVSGGASGSSSGNISLYKEPLTKGRF
jgi:hypothetical protein